MENNMKVRIICWQGRYCPQYRGWFGWVGIWYKDARCFKTEQEAIDYGKKIAAKTQFQFGSIDTPVWMLSLIHI